MFVTALLILLALLCLWAVLIYIRKTMWDAVHRNLLDLEDAYSGKVIRRSFASRPVFQGTFKGAGLTVNFSTERGQTDRRNYIDISYEKSPPISLTISNKDWLDSQQSSQELNDYETVQNQSGDTFLLIPKTQPVVSKLMRSADFITCLNELNDLAYIFFGKTGLICEFRSEQVVPDTRFEIMEKRLVLLDRIIELINKEIIR
jgi:hypothetical protein